MFKTVKLTLTVTLNVVLFLSTVTAQPTRGSGQTTVSQSGWVRTSQDDSEIFYNNSELTELEPGVLKITRNPSRVILKCKSTSGRSSNIKWVYHGIQGATLRYTQNMIWIQNGPPVFRLECNNASDKISSQVLIYRGENMAPFLHKYGDQIPVVRLDSTTVRFSCLLKYPPRYTNQLQLYKDGTLVDTRNSAITYSPEYGFTIQWTKLEQPFGNYECRVSSSTDNDYVRITFAQDDVNRGDIQVEHITGLRSFYEGEPQRRVFKCKVPSSTFQNLFEWFFLLKDGTYISANATRSTFPNNPESGYFTDLSSMHFHTRNISHVVCATYLKNTRTRVNNTYAVNIEVPVKPKILNYPSSIPIMYTKGMNLTCYSVGDPVNFLWLKDGEPVTGLNIETSYITSTKTSTLFLNPSVDDNDSIYTCKVENFLGLDIATFRVQLRSTYLQTGICLALRKLACKNVGPGGGLTTKRSTDKNRNFSEFWNRLGLRNLGSNDTEPIEQCFKETFDCSNIMK